jgi:hypothetical protein
VERLRATSDGTYIRRSSASIPRILRPVELVTQGHSRHLAESAFRFMAWSTSQQDNTSHKKKTHTHPVQSGPLKQFLLLTHFLHLHTVFAVKRCSSSSDKGQTLNFKPRSPLQCVQGIFGENDRLCGLVVRVSCY